MLRFRLGRVPVEVLGSHFLYAGLLGYMMIAGQSFSEEDAWPRRLLAHPGSPEYLTGLLAFLAVWCAIILISVLVHEMGHATAGLAFGFSPSIQIGGFGGVTHHRAPASSPWWKQVVITAAGPSAGFLLGVLCYGAAHVPTLGPDARALLEEAALVNFFWTVVNLLPVLPLDGGRMTTTVLANLFGRRGLIAAYGIGLLASLGLVAYGLLQRAVFTVAFGTLFGFQTLRALQQARTTPVGPSVPPLLAAAEQNVSKGDLDAARRDAERFLSEGRSHQGLFIARAHHLLGWVALKQGDGRRALNHFSQVQGIQVEPHALAAGFALVGDDFRAASLFERAHKENPDPVIAHEWAGTLLRLGRAQDVERIPGVDMATAFDRAERVHFLRGQFREAARAGRLAFERKPTAARAYDIACAHARGNDADDALRWLREAQKLGFGDAAGAAQDPDLASLQAREDFRAWLAALR